MSTSDKGDKGHVARLAMTAVARWRLSDTVKLITQDQLRSNRFANNSSATVTNSCGSLPSWR